MSSKDDEKKERGLYSISPEKFSSSTAALTDPKPFKEPKFTDDEPDVMCGIGSWKPAWIQKAANPKLFLFFYSMAALMQGADFTYFVGCISTMEKRFAYDTKKSGLIMISDELAPVMFGALVGYFGGLANRPRLLTFGMLIGSFSSFVMALPYFIYGSVRFDESSQRSVSRIPGVNAQFCDKDYNTIGDSCNTSATIPAVSIFFIGNFLKGLSGVIFYTIGTSYVDDSIEKKNSPTYLCTLFALRLLGPTVGFLLSSLCLQFYEDPFYDPGFGTRDPRWVGAWWMGFIILGVFIFIFTVPIILFPKRFPQKKIPLSLQKKKQEDAKPPVQQLKDMCKAMVRLLKNPILISHYLGGVLRLNGIVGYYVLLPKYMEMQFRQSASKASLYAGPASLVGMQLGIILGGVTIRRFRPRPRLLTGGIVIAESFTVIALISCMLITCPLDQMTGTDSAANTLLSLKNECNTDCKCSTKVYTPICGPDGKSTYFSPCFAGCSGYNKTDKKEVFTDCKCVHNLEGEFSMGDADKNYCGFECQWLITFVVILTTGQLLAANARVGNALVTLRCVDPEDKSIALGVSSGMYSLLAFIPYPLIYGALTDACCLVWEESCGKTGNCWVYDTDKFRYSLHGVSAGFVFAGCVTDIFVWILSPRLRNLYDEDDDVDKEKTDKNLSEGAHVINEVGIIGSLKTGFVNTLNAMNENQTTPQ